MLTLDRIIIFGKDIEALKNFYQSTLKLELIEEIEKEWLVFKAGQTEIAFHRIGLAYRNDEPFEAGGNTKIVFNVHQDLSDLRKVLIAKGVKMREIKSFEGIDFIFCDGEDIEGNVFQLYQKKL
jgi:predicted enzyme related to lactoylglutathione lyase